MDYLYRAAAAVRKQPTIKEKLSGPGSEPVGSTPAEFKRFYDGEIAQ